MVELARLIEEAVHRVSPGTRIGLMTSDPSVHAAEGRDWHGILTAFDGGNEAKAINRAHLPAYREESGPRYWWLFNGVSRLTAALLPAHTEIYPELENYPFSQFVKSLRLTAFQLDSAVVLGTKGMTLDLSDMMGNGLYPLEPYGRLLGEAKPFLDAATALDLHVRDQTGVQVLVSEKSAYTLRTARGERMEELYPNETLWASYLSAFGIANRYQTGTPQPGGAVAVSGQYFRNLDEPAVRKLFADHFVLLDGEAAYTLYEMGLGELAGIRGRRGTIARAASNPTSRSPTAARMSGWPKGA
jgi:hypothetical protein